MNQTSKIMPIFLVQKLADGYNCAICKEVAEKATLVCINKLYDSVNM